MKGDIEGATSGVGENPEEDRGLEAKEESAFKERVRNRVKHAAQR